MDDQFIIAPELSWLSFNARVLQEADNPDTPLKNRIRFLGIYSNNRDEFFRKPMPAIKQLIQLKDKKRKKILRKKTNANLDRSNFNKILSRAALTLWLRDVWIKGANSPMI